MRYKAVRFAGDFHAAALVALLAAGLLPAWLFQTLGSRLAVTVAGRWLRTVAAVLVFLVQLLQKLVNSLCQSCNLIQQFRILLRQRRNHLPQKLVLRHSNSPRSTFLLAHIVPLFLAIGKTLSHLPICFSSFCHVEIFSSSAWLLNRYI